MDRFSEKELLAVGLVVLRRYRLPPGGMHGVPHWGRVMETALELAALTGARPRVAQLFALFHDSCRLHDGVDKGHGARGAALAGELCGKAFELPPAELALLQDACSRHTDGHTAGDVSAQVCWDADRLDLPRCHIFPIPEHLCTAPAREEARLEKARALAMDDHLTPFSAALLAAWREGK